MKKIYSSLLLALLFALPALSNDVIVKGKVSFPSGAPAVNVKVWISTDSLSSPAGCVQTQVTYTDSSGHYKDTLNCSGSIVKVRIKVLNCDGTYLVENPQVNSTNIVERNFVICVAQQSCEAKFIYSTTNLTVGFSSTSTTAPGSHITSYSWSFGDGSSASTASAMHTYSAPGSYTVRLMISTSTGCKDSVTKTISVINATGTCHAAFRDSMLAPNKFIFLGGASTTAAGDSITHRIWTFGDGHGSSSNYTNVDHVYQVSGTYNVCLKIFTAKGCIDSVCKPITVVAPASGCVSAFSFQRTSSTAPYAVAFNSAASKGLSATDSIVSRFWTFGDGQQLAGNVVSPVHSYTAKGTYQVCLKITTAAGCQKTECKVVTITDTACQAKFSYDMLPGGVVKFYNTSVTAGTAAQYHWNFGDGSSGSTKDAVHTYAPGSYTACLRVYTTSGCIDSVCKTFVIPPASPNCKAKFVFEGLPVNPGAPHGFGIKVSAIGSHATSAPADSIREYIWTWGDGSVNGGMLANATHHYTSPGTYNVCLVIRTKSGCSDTLCQTIKLPLPNQINCVPKFTYEHIPSTTISGRSIRFNSSMSVTIPGDSIIYRKWEFGNGAVLTGNLVNPVYTYTNPGSYYVCLTIKTKLGCEKKECKLVVVPQVAGGCVPHFSWQRTAPKQISFNSSTSWVPATDSIVERKWNFGDGSAVLAGNVVSPVHNYAHAGIYTVALKIRTKLNCEKTFYLPVVLQDTATHQEKIRIVSLYPAPATTQMQAVVWSMQNNVQAELAVYDIYGIKKWSMNKVLLQGNNVTVVPTASLATGPYYFRVSTLFGVKSKAFFKQ